MINFLINVLDATSVAQRILGVQPMNSSDSSIFKIRHDYNVEPKYKFSRAHWYVAEYDWLHQSEVHDWCVQQFGPHPRYKDAWSRWHSGWVDRIYFRDEQDYMWFCLRWGV